MPATIHIHPTAPLAERVLLPGDPGRALRLAQALLAEPKMFNHHRGLWGYSGTASDGEPLTIQSTGMGGPSAAIVVAELADLGAHRFVRVGTCGALDSSLALGGLLIVTEARAADGTSRALGADTWVAPSPELSASLASAAGEHGRSGPVVTSDLFYDGPEDAERTWLAEGALAVEMEAAAVFALARRRGLQAACVLAVTDIVLPTRRRISSEALEAVELQLGEVALAALSAPAVDS